MEAKQQTQETCKAARERAEAEWAAHYAGQFAEAVAAGDDRKLPVYGVHGKVRFAAVSEFLGECHAAARALLFRAAMAAAQGDHAMASELLQSFAAEVAKEYGATTAEAVSLIAEPDEEGDEAPAFVLSALQFAAMDDTLGALL